MSVTVQLPGRTPATGPALASLVDAGFSSYKNYKQGQVANQEIEKNTLANKRAQDLYAQMSDENSTASEVARNTAMGQLGAISKAKPAQNADAQQGLARLSDMVKNGVMAKDAQGQVVKKPMSAIEVNNLFSENPFIKNMNDYMTKVDASAPLVQAKKQMADAMTGRLEETKNQNAAEAGQKFENDPILKASKGSINSLTRSVSILDNPNKPVTTKDLNLAYTDYINAVANGGAATEGKISRELPETFEQTWNEVKQKGGTNDDLRKSPAGAELIDMLRENIHTVNKDLKGAISDQAKNLGQSFGSNTNPKVQKTVADKLKTYTQPDAQPEAPKGKPAPGGHAQVFQDGHTYNWNPQTGKYE